jgi:AraC-like DNA-binding protein
MAQEPVTAPERARWPRLVVPAHPLLRPALTRDPVGFVEMTGPRQFVVPARAAVPLIVKLADSPYRPPVFVKGPSAEHGGQEGGDCASSYVEVWLEPLAAYTMLGVPLDVLQGRVVGLADLLGAAARRLSEQMREASTWRRRAAVLDELLLDRLDVGPRPSPEVVRAWQRLRATAGAVPVRQLADEVGWSHKHLITRFKQQVGLSPKAAARLVRFDAVCRRLDPARPPHWDRVAAEGGYADQSHLIREFRAFTGATPTAFLARGRRPAEVPARPAARASRGTPGAAAG